MKKKEKEKEKKRRPKAKMKRKVKIAQSANYAKGIRKEEKVEKCVVCKKEMNCKEMHHYVC